MNRVGLKFKLQVFCLAVCLPTLIVMTGCKKTPAPPTTLAEAQQRYGQTQWYWAKTTATLTNLSAQGFQDYFQPKPGDQISMRSSNASRILYTEFLPSSGIKAFTGMGSLQQITGITQPIYQLKFHPSKVGVVGFSADRMFRIVVEGQTPESSLLDAFIVATNALLNIRGSQK